MSYSSDDFLEKLESLRVLLLCDKRAGRNTIMDVGGADVVDDERHAAASILMCMKKDYQEITHSHSIEREDAQSSAPLQENSQVIIVTVPHSACNTGGANAMGMDLNTINNVKQLEEIQQQIDAATDYVYAERMCDRRAYVGAIALKIAFLKRAEGLGVTNIGLVVLANESQLRAECDANRFGCVGVEGGSTHMEEPTGEFQVWVSRTVSMLQSEKRLRIVWNIDSHSFPDTRGRRDNLYLLARTSPDPFARKKWALIKQRLSFNVYAGSEENYFMKWFEDRKKVPSLLVEFLESPAEYPLEDLNRDARLIINFILGNIELYKVLV
jgi:hypothetical protein